MSFEARLYAIWHFDLRCLAAHMLMLQSPVRGSEEAQDHHCQDLALQLLNVFCRPDKATKQGIAF